MRPQLKFILYTLPTWVDSKRSEETVQMCKIALTFDVCIDSQIGVKRPSKIDKTKILMTAGSLMRVESIAEIVECSLWSILQYFWPALSDNRSWKQFLVLLMRVAVLHRFYCTTTAVIPSQLLTIIVCRRSTHWFSFYRMATLKVRSRSQNLTNTLLFWKQYSIKIGQNPLLGSRDNMRKPCLGRTWHFKVLVWSWI